MEWGFCFGIAHPAGDCFLLQNWPHNGDRHSQSRSQPAEVRQSTRDLLRENWLPNQVTPRKSLKQNRKGGQLVLPK